MPRAVLGVEDVSYIIDKDCYPFGTYILAESSSKTHSILVSKKIKGEKIKQEREVRIVGSVGGK